MQPTLVKEGYSKGTGTPDVTSSAGQTLQMHGRATDENIISLSHFLTITGLTTLNDNRTSNITLIN